MENNTNPQEDTNRTDRIVDAVIGMVLFVTGLAALYSLIWANWPVFKVSVTICVTVLIGIAVGIFVEEHFGKLFKK